MILMCSRYIKHFYRLFVVSKTLCNGEKIVFCTTKDNLGYDKYINNMKGKIFHDVIYVNIGFDKFTMPESEEEFINTYIEITDKKFCKTGYDVSIFDEIYVINDVEEIEFPLYFNLKNIKYSWIECGLDYNSIALNWRYTFEGNQKCTQLCNLIKKYAATSGVASFSKNAILHETSSKSIELCKKLDKLYTTINFASSLSCIDDNSIKNVLDAFECNPNDYIDSNIFIPTSTGSIYFRFRNLFNKKSCLLKLLGNNHFSFILSTLYPFLLDLYFHQHDHFFIKFHPHDSFININTVNEIYGIFAHCASLIPFEFLCEYFRRNRLEFKNILVLQSEGSNYNIFFNKTISKNHIYELPKFFIDHFYNYYFLFTSLLICDNLKIQEILCDKYNIQLLKFLTKRYHYNFEIETYDKRNYKKMSAVFIDALNSNDEEYNFFLSENISKDICIFIYSYDEYYIPKIQGDFIMIKINKSKIVNNKKINDSVKDDILYVITRDLNLKKQLYQFKKNFIMPFSNIYITIIPC